MGDDDPHRVTSRPLPLHRQRVPLPGTLQKLPVQSDERFVTACRLVAGNALAARMVEAAQ
jgi:hypothetical protein